LKVFDYAETVCLQIFPRVFATGTDTKSYTMCTVDQQEYHNKSEPIELTYIPDTWDQMWLADKLWEYLLKLLEAGEIHAEVQGKQIVILCGHVSIFHWTVDLLIMTNFDNSMLW
jgi:hypothetical protein